MSEYLEWQQDGSPVKVRIHRRVIAGLAREGPGEFRGIALGTASSHPGEVMVEDFEPVFPGREQEFARRGRHSLPAVGYFRVSSGDDPQVTPEDRALFARYFRNALDLLLLFQLQNGSARLAQALVEPETVRRDHEPMPRRESLPRESAPARRVPETAPLKPAFRRFPWGTVAVCLIVGFLIGVAAYKAIPRKNSQLPASPATSRAVGLPADPAPVAPAPSSAKQSPFEADRSSESATAPGRGNDAEVERQIRSVLARWRETLLEDDLEAHVNLYARTVSPYFTKTRVTRPQIAEELERTLDRYGRLTMYQISNVSIAPQDANHVVARFLKRWQTEGRTFEGEETEQLKLVRQGGEWLIASEQELKVHWVRKR